MKNKLLFLIIILFINVVLGTHSLVFATSGKIVTTITPIASIISMLAEDAIEVSVINELNGCPHHYHMKPSDREKITNANMLIYIDDNFDVFINNLIPTFKGRIVKISDIASINFINSEYNNNWHFWLDLTNVLVLMDELSNILSQEFPELKNIIIRNHNKSKLKIESLIRLKKNRLASLCELVILNHSLEHFFTGLESQITKLYKKQYSSLQYLAKLETALNSKNIQCIILDNSQNSKPYEKYGKKIVSVEAENWKNETNIIDLFYSKYLEIIIQIEACKAM